MRDYNITQVWVMGIGLKGFELMFEVGFPMCERGAAKPVQVGTGCMLQLPHLVNWWSPRSSSLRAWEVAYLNPPRAP